MVSRGIPREANMSWKRLTDEQWERVKVHLPERKKPWRRLSRRGRRRVDDRKSFEAILWILWTGSPWSALPAEYGSKSTAHRRLTEWAEDGTLENLWRSFLKQLEDEDHIRWNECFVDGTFMSAKKGATLLERPSAAREQSLWYWLMARVLRSDFTWTRRRRRK